MDSDYYNNFLNDDERKILDQYDSIIIWGFPLHTHTHSYIHAMWCKVFKALHKQTYWLHNDMIVPEHVQFKNSIIITEGYADDKIPIDPSCVYFVHKAINPDKYLSQGARLIEIRFHLNEIHDDSNDYKLDDGTHNIIQLSDQTKYEKLYNNAGLHISKRGSYIKNMNYEAIYIYWGTDLLPHEFNFDDINIIPENVIYYIGTPTNSYNSHYFQDVCKKCNIQFVSINPWHNPISFEETKTLMQRSLICPDFRPTGTQYHIEKFGLKNGWNMLENGYLPCRVLKAMSYGKLGITDSANVKQILGDSVIYHPDMLELFKLCMEKHSDKDFIHRGMKHIQDNHTYIHRARDLLRALMQ